LSGEHLKAASPRSASSLAPTARPLSRTICNRLWRWYFPKSPNGPATPPSPLSSLTTYLSLVLGELVPKRIAMTAPEAIAGLVAPSMALLATISGPIVWILKASTDALLTVLGLNQKKQNAVTE